MSNVGVWALHHHEPVGVVLPRDDFSATGAAAPEAFVRGIRPDSGQVCIRRDEVPATVQFGHHVDVLLILELVPKGGVHQVRLGLEERAKETLVTVRDSGVWAKVG